MTPASDYQEEWEAARERFVAANVLLHTDLLGFSASDLDALVDAENRLGSPALEKLRSITEEGASRGEAAVGIRPDGVEGNLYLALNLAVYGLTRSSTAGLLEGLPRRIQGACGKALATDPTYAAGGGYRLQGKFLMSAPWPVRDYAQARKALERANEIAPVRQNFLFLGDLSYREGRRDDALAHWQRTCTTQVHPETAVIDAAVLELARRRMAAAGRPASEE